MNVEIKREGGFRRLVEKPLQGVVLLLARSTVNGLGMAIELSRRMVEAGHCEQLRIWSWRSSLTLGGVELTGDALNPGYRWTLTRDMLLGSVPYSRFHSAWMQDTMISHDELVASLRLKGNFSGSGVDYLGGETCVTVLEFKGEPDLNSLPQLNQAAKSRNQAVVLVADISDKHWKSYEEDSYEVMAMRLCVELGIDFPSCAETVLGLREISYGIYRCIPLLVNGEANALPPFDVQDKGSYERWREHGAEEK